jgi:glycosyltransferase involved in cell wall biosynthesis
MNICYLVATLPPKLPQAEAISQEISALQTHFGGDLVFINPNQHSPVFIPRLLFGFHKLRQLRAQESHLDFYHFYNPDPFPFLFLRLLRRPIVYSISCGLGDQQPNLAFFKRLTLIAAADERSQKRLHQWGLNNVMLVQPGIDTTRFTCSPLPLGSEIRLMVASAPWTKAQFRSKGVEALLRAAQQCARLRLIFLWRGVLVEDMLDLVRQMNVSQQVEVINRPVDVNQILAGVHATITLASNSALIKSYPHSLLDSLAAGKPVLLNRAIPMADYVEQTGCGQVVEKVTPEDILTGVEALSSHYEARQQAAQQVGQRDFSQQAMLASFQQLYERVITSTM